MKMPKKKKRSHFLLLFSTCLSSALVMAGFVYVNAHLVLWPGIVLSVCIFRGLNLLVKHIEDRDKGSILPWWWF